MTDSDTIKVRLRSGARRIVRLIGIDTPERSKPGVPVECGAKGATDFMTRLAFRRRGGRKLGHSVRLTTGPTQDQVDRYGRLLAYVNRRSDGLDLGRSIIGKGWAMAYVYDSKPFQRHGRYSATQRHAENNDRGVWASCGGDFHSGQLAGSTRPGSRQRLVRSPELPACEPRYLMSALRSPSGHRRAALLAGLARRW